MEGAQSTFISSTFWTERIGPTAALASLKVMEETQSWEVISDLGRQMKNGWQKVANESGLKIAIQGLDALASFTFVSPNRNIYKSFITQEMLKHGILGSTVFYPSMAHTSECIEEYLGRLAEIFKTIKKVEDRSVKPLDLLEGPEAHTGFTRLN